MGELTHHRAVVTTRILYTIGASVSMPSAPWTRRLDLVPVPLEPNPDDTTDLLYTSQHCSNTKVVLNKTNSAMFHHYSSMHDSMCDLMTLPNVSNEANLQLSLDTQNAKGI